MNSMKNTFGMTVLAGVLCLNAVSSSHAGAAWTLRPFNGLSFDIGTKRALSYFLSEEGSAS